ncbi:unnamed protein product [Allacma fusca]|uniref:Uncharacterized protein n=1 Tax=Allacma fusca TaxID=39272 RepID=A0A8J2JWK9_9HEXA|nr:unnamed protein product [Allacma fusca]
MIQSDQFGHHDSDGSLNRKISCTSNTSAQNGNESFQKTQKSEIREGRQKPKTMENPPDIMILSTKKIRAKLAAEDNDLPSRIVGAIAGAVRQSRREPDAPDQPDQPDAPEYEEDVDSTATTLDSDSSTSNGYNTIADENVLSAMDIRGFQPEILNSFLTDASDVMELPNDQVDLCYSENFDPNEYLDWSCVFIEASRRSVLRTTRDLKYCYSKRQFFKELLELMIDTLDKTAKESIPVPQFVFFEDYGMPTKKCQRVRVPIEGLHLKRSCQTNSVLVCRRKNSSRVRVPLLNSSASCAARSTHLMQYLSSVVSNETPCC